MNRNSLIAIIVLFCVVVGLYMFIQRPQKTTSSQVFSSIVPEFEVSSIDEIRIWTPSDESGRVFTLSRKDDSYWVEAYEDNDSFWAPCQDGRVKRLLESLRGLKGEERAAGKEFFPDFNISSRDALHFQLKGQGKTVAHILVGKRGASWGTCFVRKDGDDRVYIVQKNLFSLVDIWDEVAGKNPTAASWIELGIVKEGADAIQGVSYSSSKGVWSLELVSDNSTTNGMNVTSSKDGVDGPWVLVKDGLRHEMDHDSAKKYLSSLFPLYAKQVRSPSRAHEFGLGPSDDYGRFTIHFKAKGLKIFHVGRLDEEKKSGWIRDDRGVIYEVAIDTANKIVSGPVSLLEKDENF